MNLSFKDLLENLHPAFKTIWYEDDRGYHINRIDRDLAYWQHSDAKPGECDLEIPAYYKGKPIYLDDLLFYQTYIPGLGINLRLENRDKGYTLPTKCSSMFEQSDILQCGSLETQLIQKQWPTCFSIAIV